MSDPLKLTQDLVQSKQDLEGGTSAENATGLVATRVGYLTTWNQNCGLATYARYMLSSFPEGDYIVLAEDTPAITRKDELFVRRCWKRNSTDFSLLEEIIGREEIKLLHLNCHYRFFTQPQFGEFLTKLRARGVRVVGLIHNPFTLDAQQQALLSNVDATIVHTPENALEVIANGATPESTYVVPHGVQLAEAADRDAIRKRLGIPEYDKVLVSFGFVQPHKGMEALIESVQHLHQAGSKVRGYIVGGVMPDDPHSVQYLQSLRTIVKSLGLNDLIQFIDGFVDDRTVGEYLCIADLVLMNYQSQYYEASGACALALGAGALVATSSAPTFHSFGNAVWHITGGFPAQLSCAILLDHQTLREEILSSARDYCQRNSWHEVGQKIYAIYEKLGRLPMQTRKEMVVKTMDTQTQTTSHSALKVLFRNRANALTQRGGDTVVMQKLAEGLRARGVQVEIDLECTRDASRFDLVHLFNFATPDLTRMQAENAHAAGTPFVVTTLNEDIPSFHDQSIRVADVLKEYVRRGQDQAWYASNVVELTKIPGCQPFDNTWTANTAAALFTGGATETASILRQTPTAKTVEIPLGFEQSIHVSGSAFESEYGVKDFVLCVGRLESRKNQLMLLKALEQSDLTVVLAAGGFSYQPEYAQAVKNFKRRGRTVILDRVSDEMLIGAYSAAKVHALPSWYELPGLVSLEAAYQGTNVVATRNGTSVDILGEHAFYCNPADADSICNAVIAAWHSPVREDLVTHVGQYTWEACVERTLSAYQEIVSASGKSTASTMAAATSQTHPRSPLALAQEGVANLGRIEQQGNPSVTVAANDGSSALGTLDAFAQQSTPRAPIASPAPVAADTDPEIESILVEAESATRDKQYNVALDAVERVLARDPHSSRALRVRGAVCMAENRIDEAEQAFSAVLTFNVKDAKALTGCGMCQMMRGNHSAAKPFFVRALESDPEQLVALHQLIDCSFALGEFDELEVKLREYVSLNREDSEMLYCFAGCLYKQNKLAESRSVLEQIKLGAPSALQAQIRDLENKLAESEQASTATANTAGATSANTIAKPPIPTPFPSQVATYSYDAEIEKLIESRHHKEFDDVQVGAQRLLQSPASSSERKERAKILLGEVAVQQQNFEEGEKWFDEVLRDRPQAVGAICGKGVVAAAHNRIDQARELFTQARELDPRSDAAIAGLGLCSQVNGDHEQAWQLYQQAVDINPESPRALLGIIELGYPLQRLDEVERAIRGYLELHPADLNFLYSLAGCLYAQDRLEEAVKPLQTITLFEPDNPRAHELFKLIEEKQTTLTSVQSGTY